VAIGNRPGWPGGSWIARWGEGLEATRSAAICSKSSTPQEHLGGPRGGTADTRCRYAFATAARAGTTLRRRTDR